MIGFSANLNDPPIGEGDNSTINIWMFEDQKPDNLSTSDPNYLTDGTGTTGSDVFEISSELKGSYSDGREVPVYVILEHPPSDQQVVFSKTFEYGGGGGI